VFLVGRGGIQIPTVAAGSFVRVSVVPFEDLLKLRLDVLEYKILFVKQMVALLAIPQKTVLFSFRPFAFNNQSHRLFESLGGVRHAWRQKKDFAFTN
jgi:hypothetical protein